MSDIMEMIKARRSVRKYTSKNIAEDELNDILEAVRWSPSWANTQCWEIVVLRNPAAKKSLRQCMDDKGNPAGEALEQAPVVLALCGKLKSSGYYKNEPATKFGDWFMFDLGIAAQTICLAAHNKGLGTVIVGLFDHNTASKALRVPAGYEIVALIPVGHPAKSPSAPKRRQINEFVHHEIF